MYRALGVSTMLASSVVTVTPVCKPTLTSIFCFRKVTLTPHFTLTHSHFRPGWDAQHLRCYACGQNQRWNEGSRWGSSSFLRVPRPTGLAPPILA